MSKPDASVLLPRQRPVLFLPSHRTSEAVEITMGGIVQGVGFRPFVHRLALRYGLAGWVRNEAGAVRIRAEGPARLLDCFSSGLRTELPPLARIDSFTVRPVASDGLRAFRVVESDTTASGRLPVSPDVAICAACERELRDPADPRFRYAFITCTDCGPRFTVIEEMPYDRVRTTMRAFRQCPACLAEYEAPADRRYHSETNSCPVCGPRVWLEEPGGREGPSGQSAIEGAGRRLFEGKIVAVRGLGGFHLAVRADDEAAVARLRMRKARDAKPLAVMVRTVVEARRIARVSDAEAAKLRSAERPIVVLRRRDGSGLAFGVAPGLDSVGVMLAYTPLHHLLLDEVEGLPLVMTSGNVCDEPIATGNDEARRRLAEIADAFLLHDREIVARYDDSVLRVSKGGPIMLRRSRGYAPMPLALPVAVEGGLLAVGPHLKNTFTLAEGADAYVSQHIGDLETLETRAHFDDALGRFETLFRIEPRWVVRDLHPGYMSTHIAEASRLEELEPVQHHHAHVAAVLGEHGQSGPVLGLAFDGTGYGSDGKVWGCELLVADLVGFRRAGHLRYTPLPGGDRAARAPWRSLLGYVSLDGATWAGDALAGVDPTELEVATRQIERGLNAPLASSLGRLFDAAAAVLGIRLESRYEGQAAMELEAAAGRIPGRVLPFPVRRDGVAPANGNGHAVDILDPVPLLRALAEGRREGRSVGELAADFHETVAAASADLAADICRRNRLDAVALGGGCFQNVRLSDAVTERLSARDVTVLRPRILSPNDGAVSYGQAVVAAARLAREAGRDVRAASAPSDE